jgi:hypothetical protein
MTQVAVLETRTARIEDEFGMRLAMDKLGLSQSELETLSGRFIKGKRKGQLKAELCWIKCTVGGWNYSEQRVYKPGSFNYKLVLPVYMGRPEILATEPIIEESEITSCPFFYIWDITTPAGNLSVTTELCNSVDVISSYAANFKASECKALANWELMRTKFPNQYDN